MPKAEHTPILATEAHNQGKLTIDPRNIFGFPDVLNGADPVLVDHPDFPNPRTSPLDRDLVDEIKEARKLLEPVVLYIYEDPNGGDPVNVLLNGKTRGTSIAESWSENPDTDAFEEIPFTIFEGTADEARAFMLHVNLNDSRTPLTELETAKHLLYLEEVCGVSEEDQAIMLNKTGRGGIRWIREMKQAAGMPDVVAAVQAGDIDVTTAKEVAKIPDEEARKDVIEQVKEKTAEGVAQGKDKAKAERAARQAVTVPKSKDSAGSNKPKNDGLVGPTKTTIGFKDTIILLCDFYPDVKKMLLEPIDPDAVTWTDPSQRIAYITEQEQVMKYRTFTKFLKIDGLKMDAQFDFIEAQIKPEERKTMKIVPHRDEPAPAAPATTEKPAATKPGAAKKSVAKPSAKPAAKPAAKKGVTKK